MLLTWTPHFKKHCTVIEMLSTGSLHGKCHHILDFCNSCIVVEPCIFIAISMSILLLAGNYCSFPLSVVLNKCLLNACNVLHNFSEILISLALVFLKVLSKCNL